MIDDAVRAYLDALPPDRRPLFDRFHRLVMEAHPDADVILSYRMPTYVVGDYRLHVGVWKHGLSVYGWVAGRDGGFSARHPQLVNDTGTLRLPLADAERIGDDELRELAREALGGRQ